MPRFSRNLLAVAVVVASCAATAQTPIPRSPTDLPGFSKPKEPAELKPAARTFVDRKYKLHFEVPGGWDLEHKDGYLSNFSHDSRDTVPGLDVRGVAAINYNPWPPTTFSGALFYYSVKAKSNAADCEGQTKSGSVHAVAPALIDGVKFNHGRDEYGIGCIQSRIDVFTTLRGNACIRFDMVINTYCASNSGAVEINARQLGDVQSRLAKILGSIRFDKK